MSKNLNVERVSQNQLLCIILSVGWCSLCIIIMNNVNSHLAHLHFFELDRVERRLNRHLNLSQWECNLNKDTHTHTTKKKRKENHHSFVGGNKLVFQTTTSQPSVASVRTGAGLRVRRIQYAYRYIFKTKCTVFQLFFCLMGWPADMHLSSDSRLETSSTFPVVPACDNKGRRYDVDPNVAFFSVFLMFQDHSPPLPP